ncbi:MAG TPA: VTT domain-containing protein [Candidatus Saccharimonadales bacterium]
MIDPNHLLEGTSVLVGLTLIGLIITAETGLLIGFFLPGDTLLFTAGFFAAQGKLPLAAVLTVIFFSAIIGDNIGYTIGKKTGPRLFKKKDGIIFRQEYIQHAKDFYEKHGGKTIIIARYVPIVRTFAPLIAGVAHMSRARFFAFNVLGAFIWTVSIVLAGYWLGSLIDPKVMEKFIVLAISLATLVTMGPTLYHLLKEKRLRAFVSRQFTRVINRLRRKNGANDDPSI